MVISVVCLLKGFNDMKKYQDQYFKKARKENYPARSVYKLKEMDKKFHLFSPGLKVLDLGAAPGSWTLYAAQKVQDKGLVVAVDLQNTDVSFPGYVVFIQGDVFDPQAEAARIIADHAPYDLVMSDMAPRTTGIKFTDQARSFNLAMESLYAARQHLGQSGSFITKILEGPDIQELQKEMRSSFNKVKHFKPKSSRMESKEVFLVGLELI